MNRDRKNSFGRRQTRAGMSSVPPTTDECLLAARSYHSTDEAGPTRQEQTKGRVEALGFIICRIDELRQMAASHGLETLGRLLEVAFTESCDALRRERASTQADEATRQA